ncbi:TPA: helix-turn-helix transcriptional regulator [Acinetobacter baumannii]|uniref:helix-turn-helix domain-containing protein n=1 Tax=Acinetobacter calcoaceticus/baumannii complex TaxID=909768 RepID=UPI000344E079|nr:MULTISPECIES: helix-turn-helix transcriptional regulator [Acinetobacter calcoaceticus/baumannii complex]MBZ0354789.1 helix-turn-helix transcriptional regulator [Acinetobacter baumannii]MDQ9038455.1 helix-turn-helix transcriptional regulator [Acinetobacter seifertii]MDR5636956.1 helix-turn-helix transcriptional regulator [Acinetobacter baumannii]MDR8256525.1 helix-turn-helix transcriptional regulator [Acinetobacter baumannii]MDT1826813.1 helix-turn-helix transcriptional regulator [Acinetobac
MESKINPISIELGKRLKLERERLNLSQDSFASINDLTARTVIEWEKGKTFPNLLQLVKLTEKGLNINALFDEIFKNKFVDRLIFNDINFVEKKGDYVLTAIDRINSIFTKNPSWKLINIETKYSKSGEEVGLRYYYTYPLAIVFDESQAVRDSYMDNLIRDVKKNSYTNK